MKQIARDLNNFALPLMIQSISSIVVGIVDQAMIGRISIEAFAAVGIISGLLYLVTGVLGGFAITLNVKGAQAIGAADRAALHRIFGASLVLNILIGSVFLLLIATLGSWLLMHVYHLSTTALMAGMDYLKPMQFYLLIQLVLFSYSALFKIENQTKWLLIGSFATNILNLVLNYLFIFGPFGLPKLGAFGVGLGTMLAMLSALIFYAFLTRQIIDYRALQLERSFAYYREIISYSLPLIGQEILEDSLFELLIGVLLAQMGVLIVSGYILVSKVRSLVLMPVYMYASGALNMVSRHYGARQNRQLKLVPIIAVVMSYFFLTGLIALCYFFREPIIRLITDKVDLINYSRTIFLVVLISYMAMPLQQIFKSCLQAIDRANYVFWASLVVNGVIIVGLFALTMNGTITLNRLLVGLFLNMAIVGVVFALRYYRAIRTFDI